MDRASRFGRDGWGFDSLRARQAQVCAWLRKKTEADRRLRQVQYCTCQGMKFYYVYILHNNSKNFIYVGFSENLKSRVASHAKGKNKSTKSFRPLELIFYEAYRSKKDAKRRELYLKSNRGRTTLITMLKDYFDTN